MCGKDKGAGAEYRVKEGKVQTKERQFIFVISGPSGSGKTTLLKKLLRSKKLKRKIVKSVSYTTRPKRPAEKEGREYFFIAQELFKKKLKAKKILEWTRYLGYYYATSREFVESQLKKGRHIIFCLDLKGALKIKRLYPENAVTIFIVPPSIEALRSRMERRCSETAETEIYNRLKLARQELLNRQKYDYCVVNKSLEQAISRLEKILLREMRG